MVSIIELGSKDDPLPTGMECPVLAGRSRQLGGSDSPRGVTNRDHRMDPGLAVCRLSGLLYSYVFVDFIEAFYAPVHHLLARSLRARADQQETSIWVAEIPRHVVRALPVPERNASQALKTLSAPMSVRFLMHGGLAGSGDRRRKPQDHQFPGHHQRDPETWTGGQATRSRRLRDRARSPG